MWKRVVLLFMLIAGATGITGAALAAAPPHRQAPYSTERAEEAFNAGKSQYQNGALAQAVGYFQKALEYWPVHQGAWQWLTGAYQHLEQTENYQHALFFRERTAWALDVDLRHAKRIFDDVAKRRKRATDLDARYAETARALSIFYGYIICRTQAAREAELAKRLTIDQKYGLEKILKLTPDPKRRVCWPVK